jgi:hypothetical protein
LKEGVFLFDCKNIHKTDDSKSKDYASDQISPSVEKLDSMTVPKYVNQLEKPLIFYPRVVKARFMKTKLPSPKGSLL